MSTLNLESKGNDKKTLSVLWINNCIVLPCVLLLSVAFLKTASSAADLNIETDKLFLSETIHVDAVSNQASGTSQVFSMQ